MYIGKYLNFTLCLLLTVCFICFSVKPAIFDLILTLAIIVYLGSVYLIVQKFPSLYSAICSITASKKKAN